MNCAQAIVGVYKEKYQLDSNIVDQFKQYGGGQAPEGLCGAYYAARCIVEKDPNKVKELERFFIEQAGSLQCKEIKKAKKLSCVGCVEKSAEYLKNLKPQ